MVSTGDLELGNCSLNLALSAASNVEELWEVLDTVVDETTGKYSLPESSVRCILEKLELAWSEADAVHLLLAVQALLLDFREVLQSPTRACSGRLIDTSAQRVLFDYVEIVESLTESNSRDVRCAAKYVLACWERSKEEQLILILSGIVEARNDSVETATSILAAAVVGSRLENRASWLPRILGSDFWEAGETDLLVCATAALARPCSEIILGRLLRTLSFVR